MRKLWAILCVAAFSFAQSASAQNTIVVELYTSQGCSSCPPADKLLHDLAKRDDIIALALHVDYWDYIGWKDEFADPRFTERQKGYARAAGARSIYTPQMIIGGQDHVIGTRPGEVTTHLSRHSTKSPAIEIVTERSGASATVRAQAVERVTGGVIVQVVTYRPTFTVSIKRGENAGRTLDYANVVTSWTEAERWNGRGSYQFNVTLPTADPAVVLFQRPDHGEILAAAHIR